MPRPSGVTRTTIIAAAALCLMASVRCTSYVEGIEVAVGFERSQANPGGFLTDLGYEVALEQGYASFGSVEILPCRAATPSPPEEAALSEVLLEALSPLGNAKAHTATSPTVLGVPFVQNMVADPLQRTTMTGWILPPPGTYCTARVWVEPADSDAMSLPTDINLVGRTLHLDGTYRAPDGEPVPFTVRSSLSRQTVLSFSEPLELSEGRRSAELIVRMDQEKWFDGVDLASISHGGLVAAVTANLSRSLVAVHR